MDNTDECGQLPPSIHVFSCLTSSDLMIQSNLKEYLFSNQFSNFLLQVLYRYNAQCRCRTNGLRYIIYSRATVYCTVHRTSVTLKGDFSRHDILYIYYIRLETLLPRVAEVLLRHLYCSIVVKVC